jgi:hypothetical protein
MSETTVKEEARRIVDLLPEDATWADLADIIAMHERLARARRDSAAGLGITLEELEKEHGFTG